MNPNAVISGRDDGPTYVLIHGLGQTHHVWDRVTPLLEMHGRVTAINIGHSTTIEDEADAIAELIQSTSVVVGLSRGGLVATAIAEHRPELVARLVLFCPPWSQTSRLAARSTSERILALPGLGQAAWALAAGRPTKKALARAFAPNTPLPDQFVTDLRSRGLQDLIRSTTAIDHYLKEATLPRRLTNTTTPTRLIQGAMDGRVAPFPRTTRCPPHVKLIVLDGVGHTPPWEVPEVATQIITSET